MSRHFRGRTAVLATRHGKEQVVAPILERELGIRVIVPPDFDSDRFGTFTRDVARAGNQLDAARSKARAAMKLTGVDLGIASEGSFGADPHIPFLQSNHELVLLLDDARGHEIRGHHRSNETNVNGAYVSSPAEARQLALAWGFPEHGVIVRTGEHSRRMYKEIATLEELEACVGKLLYFPFRRKVYMETDMRAHRNPTRMKNIEQAVLNLATHCRSECPRCGAPGFTVVEMKGGVPCRWCGRPTDIPSSAVSHCHACDYRLETPLRVGETADPGSCGHCNP